MEGMNKTLTHLLQALTVITLVAISQASLAKEVSTVEVKIDSLRQLQELRTKNVKRLHDIDAALAKKFDDSRTSNLETEVETLRADKQEHVLRQEFLDRLI